MHVAKTGASAAAEKPASGLVAALDAEQRPPERDLLALGGIELGELAVERRLQRDLHLYRLEDDERLARPDGAADRAVDREDRAGHGGGHRPVGDAGGRVVEELLGTAEDVRPAAVADGQRMRGALDEELVQRAVDLEPQ